MATAQPNSSPKSETSSPRPVPSGRSHLRSLMGVQILGTGSYVPDRIVPNEDLSSLGCDPQWIIQRTGIRERRHAPEEIATSDMAYQSAIAALEVAGVDADEIDLIVVGTFTPDSPTPSTACRLQQQLGIRAAAMDVSAACAGFLYALITAAQFIKCGTSQRALVVGADLLSRIANPNDKKTYPLFGDGAGAVVLGPGKAEQGMISYTLGSEGEGAEMLCVPGGGSKEPLSAETLAEGKQYLQMDGRGVFKWAVRVIEDSIRDVLFDADLRPEDISLVMLHQANVRIIDAACENLGFPREKMIVNLDRYGNTSAGSVPIVLDEAAQKGLIKPGDRVLMCGFGAGLSWGTCVFQW
ncbi:beta-ketoacyl-ACP synthase III [Blastopirellula marina]|uniref:Beta-ketoacyl-[acyl-carrier-protein] synthase III n=1 Tax=Blastopirellula marina TaxID=124 RepID=A0A2S8GMI6_9BACT|nr:beta-ketoacyl-ACP synthase III [Blastopirellula marina]PQO45628.1 ketoacyl-ACP synthase III [Blastopirellula marina]